MAASRRRARTAALTLLVVLAISASPRGQSTIDYAFHAFQDSRNVMVISPDVSVDHALSDRTAVRARFGVDAISSASENCLLCHPKGPTNRRLAGTASVTRRYGDTKVTIGGELSNEFFYRSAAVMTSISRELNKGNTTVGGGFSYAHNKPEMHPSEIERTNKALGAYASLTQSWTRSTVTQVGYEINQIDGYQANQFERSTIDGILVPDRVPQERTRHTVSARLRQGLPGGTFFEGDYRYYVDSWEVLSNTFSAGLSRHLGGQVVAGGSFRWYGQDGAFFYQPVYTTIPQYLTADFRLFPFTSNSFSGRLAITPTRAWFGAPAGSTLSLEYERYVADTGFDAHVFTAALRIPFRQALP